MLDSLILITGIVLSSAGNPLPNIDVKIVEQKGYSRGITNKIKTDHDGKYQYKSQIKNSYFDIFVTRTDTINQIYYNYWHHIGGSRDTNLINKIPLTTKGYVPIHFVMSNKKVKRDKSKYPYGAPCGHMPCYEVPININPNKKKQTIWVTSGREYKIFIQFKENEFAKSPSISLVKPHISIKSIKEINKIIKENLPWNTYGKLPESTTMQISIGSYSRTIKQLPIPQILIDLSKEITVFLCRE